MQALELEDKIRRFKISLDQILDEDSFANIDTKSTFDDHTLFINTWENIPEPRKPTSYIPRTHRIQMNPLLTFYKD